MKKKTIALIAHDNKKKDMIAWAQKNKDILANFNLCGTGTTAGLVEQNTGLNVKRYLSGPLGGDLEIGAKVAEGAIDVIVFLWEEIKKLMNLKIENMITIWKLQSPILRQGYLSLVEKAF